MNAQLRTHAYKHYVYHLKKGGQVKYVGKGSARRLQNQQRKYQLDGEIVCLFKNEEDAYAFERQQISELNPELNVHAGGNGCRTKKKREQHPAWLKEINQIGTRTYAARLLMKYCHLINDISTVEAIRKVAYGN